MEPVNRSIWEQLGNVLRSHRSERNGMTILLGIMLLLAGHAVYQQWFRPAPQTDLPAIEQELRSWIATRRSAAESVQVLEPFAFDPNTLDREGWLALGLQERQVDGILRYRDKGGVFRTKRDVARLYGLREGDYERLQPFIQLPDSLPRRRPRTWPKRDHQERTFPAERTTWTGERAPRPAITKVEVNTADSAALVALPGIGPSFARGILAYRDRLGGYRSLDQLAEVYVLRDKPDALARMEELLVVDSLMLRRIPINTCTVEELAAHPYISWDQARPLMAYRTQHGPFQAVSDIRKSVVIDEATFLKLAPYLTVE